MRQVILNSGQEVVFEGDHLPIDADPVPGVLRPERGGIFAREQAVAFGPSSSHHGDLTLLDWCGLWFRTSGTLAARLADSSIGADSPVKPSGKPSAPPSSTGSTSFATQPHGAIAAQRRDEGRHHADQVFDLEHLHKGYC